MIATERIQPLLQGKGEVVDASGNKIGKVGQLYLDDETGQPEWVTVQTGLFGTSESFVPIRDAELEGEKVRVPYDKDMVKDAPRIDADGHLDESEEDQLYSYYHLDETGVTDLREQPAGDRNMDADFPMPAAQGGPPGPSGGDRSEGESAGRSEGTVDDGGMTGDATGTSGEPTTVAGRPEPRPPSMGERGGEQHAAGHAHHLRRYVVTEVVEEGPISAGSAQQRIEGDTDPDLGHTPQHRKDE